MRLDLLQHALTRSGPPPALEWGAAVAVALVAVSGALGGDHAIGDGVDMYGTLWFYWWILRCLVQLDDPGHTELFFYPLGKDIFAHTGNNFVDAVFAAPLVAGLGIPLFSPVFVALLIVANARAFRVLAGLFCTSGWGVFAASLAWAMNPFLIFELSCGRYTQGFLVFLPLALAALVRLERAPGAQHAALAGLWVALVGWTYWFNGWFLVFSALGFGALALARSPTRGRLLAYYAMSAGVCLLAIAPAGLSMALAAGQGEVPGLSQAEAPSLWEPPGALGNNVASSLHGLVLMELQGAPMLTHPAWLAVAGLWLLVGRHRAWGLAALALPLVLSVGPVLELPGLRPRVMPHYMAAYHGLPFFDRLWFPYRMVVVPLLVLCVGLGTVVDHAVARWPARARLAWVPLALFCAWTGLEQHRFAVFPLVAREVRPPETFRWLGEQPGGAVLHLPFGITQPAIVWQTFHGKPLFGGMGENAPLLWPPGYKDKQRNAFFKALVAVTRDPLDRRSFTPAQRARFEQDGFRWVVLHRDLLEADIPNRAAGPRLSQASLEAAGLDATRALVELLGPPVAAEGALVTWDLQGQAQAPDALAPTEAALYTRTWGQDEMPAYERALREQGRMKSERGGRR